MANIQPYVDNIRNSRFGRDVRESIAAGIEAMNDESESAYNKAVTAQDSASASASAALDSANEAATSASNASTSATTATNSVETVLGYRNEAETFKNQASASATSASQSATSAEASASNATNQAVASANSAIASADSASNARNSAESALSSMNTASANANSAQESALQASSSMTLAATSANNARTSEINAENWARQAQEVAGIGIMTTASNGIGRPDGTSITVNEFGVFSARGITEHIEKKLTDATGVHGTRVSNKSLQVWSDEAGSWVEALDIVKSVDTALSTTSTNPVQNKVITGELNSRFVKTTDTSTADEKTILKTIFNNHAVGSFEVMVTVYGKTMYGIAGKYNASIWSCLLVNIENGNQVAYSTNDGGTTWKELSATNHLKSRTSIVDVNSTNTVTVDWTQYTLLMVEVISGGWVRNSVTIPVVVQQGDYANHNIYVGATQVADVSFNSGSIKVNILQSGQTVRIWGVK